MTPEPEERPAGLRCEDCGEEARPRWWGLGPRPRWQFPRLCERCKAERLERARAARAEERRAQVRATALFRAGLEGERRLKTLESFRPVAGTEEGMQGARRLLAECRDLDALPARGLLFVGGWGSGKTHLAAGIANALFDRFYDGGFEPPVRMVELASHLDRMRRAFRSGEGEVIDREREPLYRVPMLVLDDITAPAIRESEEGDWIREDLCRLLNERLNASRPTVVTADQSQEDMARRLGGRIVSRLYEACEPLPLTAPDYRLGARRRRA